MRSGRCHGGEVERRAGVRADAWRIDEPESADPHVVLRTRWKSRQQVAALIVGDHDLGVPPRTEAGRLRDDPHAGFRSLDPGHHPSNIGRANPNRLGANLVGPNRHERGDDDCCRACVRGACRTHANPPCRNSRAAARNPHCYTPKRSACGRSLRNSSHRVTLPSASFP